MQTRKDHVQAYQFAMGRLATALVTGDPGRGESPTKKAALGTFFGAGIVVLLCAGFGVYGLISPGTTDAWRSPGSIIVEKETGNRYLFAGGELHPVLNYASALLLAGKTPTVRQVSTKSLGNTPHGAPVGITGAPDSMPAPTAMLPGDWTRCLRPTLPNGQVVDFDPAGSTTPFPAGRQVELTGTGGPFLLWNGVKYPVPATSTMIALGLDGDQSVAAPANWLSSVPTGAKLEATPIHDEGQQAGQVGGHQVEVGQLFRTSGSGNGHDYVMLSDGISQVSPTESALLAARSGAAAPLVVSASDVAAAKASTDTSMTAHPLPDVLDAPALATGGKAVCLRQTSDGAKLTSRLVVESGPAATGSRTVLVPPNRGLLAVDQEQVAQQSSDPETFLVTDQGIAFPMGDQSAAASLKVNGPKTALPGAVILLLGHGPVLDSAAAARPVRGG